MCSPQNQAAYEPHHMGPGSHDKVLKRKVLKPNAAVNAAAVQARDDSTSMGVTLGGNNIQGQKRFRRGPDCEQARKEELKKWRIQLESWQIKHRRCNKRILSLRPAWIHGKVKAA